jgi:hypothetical protein
MGTNQCSGVVADGVVWYLSSRLSEEEELAYALSARGVVVRGESGAEQACRLRAAGYEGSVWLDPASYDGSKKDAKRPAATLLGDRWVFRQDELRVAERISPGTYVAGGDREGLAKALDVEAGWVADAGGGRVSLALHHSWLTDGLDVLIPALSAVDVPIAVALAHDRDPLSPARSVSGLVALIHSVADVAILRCDLGAIGGVAHGAGLGAIGTSSTVRHFFIGTFGGQGDDRSPSVFVRELLDFRRGSFLDELPAAASPVCHLPCCGGQPLRRFNDEELGPEARAHNRIVLCAVIDEVMRRPVSERAACFRALCQEAVVAAAELGRRSRREIEARAQVRNWARLTPLPVASSA